MTSILEALPWGVRQLLRRLRGITRGTWPPRLAMRTLSKANPSPKTFNEKVLFRMAFDRRPILVTFADKYEVREFVAERAGIQILPKLYSVIERGDRMDWSTVPKEFACKPTHGAGACVLSWSKAEGQLPHRTKRQAWEYFSVPPHQVDPARMELLFSQWLSQKYQFGPSKLPEWAYGQIKPRVIIEELLVNSEGDLPRDYKFFVFDGRCQMIQIHGDRLGRHTCDLVWPNYERIPVRHHYPVSDVIPEKPACFDQMLGIAEELGGGMDFIRVDLYAVDGEVKFGEMTNYPRAGTMVFDPPSFDRDLGGYWTLQQHQSGKG